MTRAELEHAIRAACDVSGDNEVYVFGSQAILGQYPDAPESLRQSAEADIAPVTAIDMVDVIDAHLMSLSMRSVLTKSLSFSRKAGKIDLARIVLRSRFNRGRFTNLVALIRRLARLNANYSMVTPWRE